MDGAPAPGLLVGHRSAWLLAVLAVILTGTWVIQFRGGLNWASGLGARFNWHPGNPYLAPSRKYSAAFS